MECTLHLECTWSGIGVYFYWWVIWPSPWSGILVYTYNIRSVVGVYTPVGVVTKWLWSVHSKLECTLRQGKGRIMCSSISHPIRMWFCDWCVVVYCGAIIKLYMIWLPASVKSPSFVLLWAPWGATCRNHLRQPPPPKSRTVVACRIRLLFNLFKFIWALWW